MHPNEIAKFVQAGFGPVHLRTETIKYLLGFIIKKLNQNIVFILKIKIDGAVGDPGYFGNLGNGRLMKSVSGKNLDRRFKDLVIFIIFFDPVNDGPPWFTFLDSLMNECSFIIYQNLFICVKHKV